MLPWLMLALTIAGVQNLDLAPGQQPTVRSHETDFPKVAWVATENLPISGSPSLGGRLVAVFHRGDKIEVAGFAGHIPRPGEPGAVDDILAIGIGSFGFRGAGYFRAADAAVMETALGHCCGDTLVFSSVIGRSRPSEDSGMVLDLAVWARTGDSPPERLLLVPNRAPGPRLVPVEGGAAVEAAGRVVILDDGGQVVFRTGESEQWTLEEARPEGFLIVGPGGKLTVNCRGEKLR
jgi:hypothetical protein